MIIETSINGVDLQFKTAESLFSPKRIDRGTLAMLSVLDLKEDDKVRT